MTHVRRALHIGKEAVFLFEINMISLVQLPFLHGFFPTKWVLSPHVMSAKEVEQYPLDDERLSPNWKYTELTDVVDRVGQARAAALNASFGADFGIVLRFVVAIPVRDNQLDKAELRFSIKHQVRPEDSKPITTKLGDVILDLSKDASRLWKPPTNEPYKKRRESASYELNDVRPEDRMRRFLMRNGNTNALLKLQVACKFLGGESYRIPPPKANSTPCPFEQSVYGASALADSTLREQPWRALADSDSMADAASDFHPNMQRRGHATQPLTKRDDMSADSVVASILDAPITPAERQAHGLQVPKHKPSVASSLNSQNLEDKDMQPGPKSPEKDRKGSKSAQLHVPGTSSRPASIKSNHSSTSLTSRFPFKLGRRHGHKAQHHQNGTNPHSEAETETGSQEHSSVPERDRKVSTASSMWSEASAPASMASTSDPRHSMLSQATSNAARQGSTSNGSHAALQPAHRGSAASRPQDLPPLVINHEHSSDGPPSSVSPQAISFSDAEPQSRSSMSELPTASTRTAGSLDFSDYSLRPSDSASARQRSSSPPSVPPRLHTIAPSPSPQHQEADPMANFNNYRIS